MIKYIIFTSDYLNIKFYIKNKLIITIYFDNKFYIFSIEKLNSYLLLFNIQYAL